MNEIFDGVIGTWFTEKRTGFIIPKDKRLKGVPSIFFCAEEVEEELIKSPAWPRKGQSVRFCLIKDGSNRDTATNIHQT